MAEDSNNTSGNKSNINVEFNTANAGLNQDNSLNQVGKGSLTYALNAMVENFDSNSVNYQNEPGNTSCIQFPEGYVLIGKHFIPERNKHIYFLVDPVNKYSQIGYMDNNDCQYRVLACSSCLNFDVNYPIHKIVHQVTKYGTEIYWPDNNGRRYLNIDEIPKPLKYGSSLCDPVYDETDCAIDCEKIKVQPNFTIPVVNIVDAISGGSNKAGTLQFAVQYSDAKGNPYTSYYGMTNPVPIADTNLATVNFDYQVGRSIVIDIQNLDVTGQYQYFNLAVLKTVNSITTPELAGTYFIDRSNKQITYTGQNKTNIQLSIEDVFERFPYYEKADNVTAVQDILVWNGLTSAKRVNYQKIANKIKLNWQSYRLPASTSYADEVIAANYKSYLRDEIYAIEISFLLTNGKETDGFHIPGREKNSFELTAPKIYSSNPDFIGSPDTGKDYASYWKIYNTASVLGTSEKYKTNSDYLGPYQYGDFAYWESIEEYPCNKDIWGDLAGKKIRHHKFPDNIISPIFESDAYPGKENLVMEDRAIFPIGIKVDYTHIKSLIANSSLSDSEKNEIVGFKILRGDRGVNKSIIAKGMLRNVNKYTRENQDFYYPNYPYNDLNEDVFLNKSNNAWSDLSKPFEVNVVEFNLPKDNPTYLEVKYIDPNNNKEATIKYTTLGKQETLLCSLSVPIIQGLGVKNKLQREKGLWVPTDDCIATVGYANYDRWLCRVKVREVTGTYMAGFRMEWQDPIEGTKQRWFSGRDNIILNTVTDTVPINISSGSASNNHKLTQYPSVTAEDCKTAEPVDSIETDESLAYRQIFNSPDTSFGQPFLGSILKLENVIYGKGTAHFVEVKNNAKYRLLTAEAQEDALKSSEELAKITSPFNMAAMFTAYQAYLEIYINGITRKNYGYSYNSIASYNYAEPISNNKGVKQRNLENKKYLIPAVQSIGEQNTNINNYNRETSVYLKTVETQFNNSVTALPLPSKTDDFLYTGLYDRSRLTIGDTGYCSTPAKEQDIEVVSYYGSLKNEFINQWGQIYSYDTIDTGYTVIFGKESLSSSTVFGGDTFIGKFAYKTKVPFFIDNRVDAPDDSDIFYDEIGNIAYPKYWHSSRSKLKSYSGEDVFMSNIISYKAHNFDCPNDQGGELDDADDPANYPDRTYYNGYMYLFAYGVPSFYCESSYNLDLRQAFNNKEGDFWPHVSSGIPDDWVQETNVSILNDNTYNYNVTYSKQNKESAITHLPEDWDEKYSNTSYPFRAIYSDIRQTDADSKVNNWLTYRALSYFDFPQNFGGLTSLDGLANKAILARFENKSLLYNSLITIDTSNPQAAYIGNPKLFSNPPIDYADTDLGYIGSQHKMILKVPQGAVFADAKRGQIFLVNNTDVVDLTTFGSGMNRFFTDHLSFEILKHFPDVDVDNNFNGVGLHGVYDAKFDRIIFTKLDYIPLTKNIKYVDYKFYDDLNNEVFLTDSEYFCNKSWTISFNFNTKSWISFHSYLPNWYIGENNYFYSGVNYCPNDFNVLVGILSKEFNTTTTTTTRVLPSTTTTTTTEFIPDCTFDFEVTTSYCDFEAMADIIYTPEVCTRPSGLDRITLISGYTLVTPVADIDSTLTYIAACTNLGYYVAYGDGGANYNAKKLYVECENFALGNVVYLNNGTNDCSVAPDGWYFTDESSSYNLIYRIQNGLIVEEYNCNAPLTTTTSSTTTTTTTIIPPITVCYTGVYTNPDEDHPLGGIISYVDSEGVLQTINNIWVGDAICLLQSSIVSAVDVILQP